MLEKLGNALRGIVDKVAGAIFLDKKLIDEITSELRYALISADVDMKIISEIIEKIRKEASRDIKGVEKKEQLIKLLNDEIINILGKEKHELEVLRGKCNKFLFLGLYGSGKTTTIAKIANYYSKRGYRVCMVGLDVHRPAAPEQLEQLARKINITYFIDKEEKNPVAIWEKYENKIKNYDICLVDTAGRDALDSGLIKEIKEIIDKIKPEKIILVMPADIGQAARRQVEEFKKACNIEGNIITRMDGTAKAGGALVACRETSSPVFFIGTGEHIIDIEVFNPKNFVSRILGMGDLQALLDKIKLVQEEKKDASAEFTLISFYNEIKTMQNMGPLSKITDLIPGMGNIKMSSDLIDIQQNKVKKWKYAIDSMTKKEIENPEIIKDSRISRIAKGSGTSTSDIKEMIDQYRIIKNLVGKKEVPDISSLQRGDISKLGIGQKQLRRMAKKFKGKIPGM